jgi:hypothetical protein
MELHEGLVLLKDLPNPPRLNGICMNKQVIKINQGEKSIKITSGISRVQYLMELHGV